MGLRGRQVRGVITITALALAALAAFGGSAYAAPPDFLLQMPEDQITPGSGAAELKNPRGIAGDPETGHVYISDLENARISEYTAWGLFVKSWGWGVANGASALQTCGPAQPESNPPPGLCQSGIAGADKGQIDQPLGITVDGTGNVYVFELANLRVQKFSPTGAFLLTFGGEVNKTTNGDVCTQASGDECGKGTGGSGPSHLAGTVGNFIDYSANTILVGDKDRIQIFNLDGTFKEEIPFEGPLAAFAGESVNALDVDKDGNIYLSLNGLDGIYKLSPAGVPLAPGKPGESKFKVKSPRAVAVDVEGGVYAVEQPGGTASMRMLKFDAAGTKLLPTKSEEEAGEFFPYIPFQGPSLNGLATNLCPGSDKPGNLYLSFFQFAAVSHVNAYGTGPIGCEDPPPRDPEVLAQYATSVGRKEATVRADINPRFFTDATYYVEYGTGKCSEGGCPSKAPIAPANLTGKSVNRAVRSAGVLLEGLQPGTTYHYRFVAESGFSLPDSNGPVFGEDPDGKEGPQEASFEEGVERTFRTFAAAGSPPTCAANKAFRTGASAKLPDCRAYEMVSPLDKQNADVAPWLGKGGSAPRLFELDQSATSGEKFAFTSFQAFDEPEGAPFVSQYLADRTGAGWASGPISPPHSTSPVGTEALLSNEFHGFSSDLCMAWIRHYSVDPLAEEGIAGFANIYRRDNCEDPPGYEAQTAAEPTNRAADRYFELRALGFSEDGTHSIFTANASLLGTEAPALKESELLLYEHSPEGLRFVCYLPSGNPSSQACGAGTAAGTSGGNQSSVHNAISADGSRIFWTAYSGTAGFGEEAGAPGQIYVRIDGSETLKVSGQKATDPAWFWTASADGSKAIFAFDTGPLKDELYEFDVDTQTASLIAKQVEGPMGASEDASRIYLASKEDLDEGGPAAAGAHNLYLYEAGEGEGTFTFIMALDKEDIAGGLTVPAPIDELPIQRSATVSPDGLHVAFTSAVSPTPTGYDNLDAVNGEPDQEVYLYDAGEDELRCVSCNPSGARPVGEPFGRSTEPVWIAARIQGWEALLHSPRVVSDDGTRVFFESREALVPGDTNNEWDVYQWEALGKGGCTEAWSTFSEASEGCVDLISSGENDAESTFLDADPSGENVFIGTESSLIGVDYGLNDVYDARVGGGFPEPVVEPECEGEACQSPPPPPHNPTAASEAFRGAGNEKAKPARKRCKANQRRVKRKGKVRCVPKHRRKAHAKRRAVR
jgi:DNA-binding beta-propeller fold protein YncE